MSNHTYFQWLSGGSLSDFYKDAIFQVETAIDLLTEGLSAQDASQGDAAITNLIAFYSTTTAETPALSAEVQYQPALISSLNQPNIEIKIGELEAIEISMNTHIV